MPIEIVTDMRVLMHLARVLGQARKSGNEEVIAKAQQAHDNYRDLCLKADRMNLGLTTSVLS